MSVRDRLKAVLIALLNTGGSEAPPPGGPVPVSSAAADARHTAAPCGPGSGTRTAQERMPQRVERLVRRTLGAFVNDGRPGPPHSAARDGGPTGRVMAVALLNEPAWTRLAPEAPTAPGEVPPTIETAPEAAPLSRTGGLARLAPYVVVLVVALVAYASAAAATDQLFPAAGPVFFAGLLGTVGAVWVMW